MSGRDVPHGGRADDGDDRRAGSREDAVARLHRPFRPRAARLVSWAVAGVYALGMTFLAVVVPRLLPVTTPWLDRVGFAVLVAAGVWFLSRHAGVRADPDPSGLTVRNLVVTRRVEWAEIVSVRFGQGRPWVQLDLADGTTLAVMGIQRADGARSVAEARRLATLVAHHSTTSRDD